MRRAWTWRSRRAAVVAGLAVAALAAAREAKADDASTPATCLASRRRADELLARASAASASPRDPSAQREIAASYYGIWLQCAEPQLKAGDPPLVDHPEDLLVRAAAAFRSAGLLASAINVRRKLIAADVTQSSSAAKDAMFEVARDFETIAAYDQAADWYEKYAHAGGHMPHGGEAIVRAVRLRLALNQLDLALAHAHVADKLGRGSSPSQNASIALAVAARHAELKDWTQAESVLTPRMGGIDADGGYEVRVQAHALLGRIEVSLGHAAAAAAEYAKVRTLWADPDAAKQKIMAEDGDEATKTRRVGSALVAVGEAYFYAAEQDRASRVDGLPMPTMRGGGRGLVAVTAFIKAEIAPWIEKRRAAIVAVEEEYRKVFALSPPPPRWSIMAAARAGSMWSELADSIRRAPVPTELTVPGLAQAYSEAMERALEPTLQRAKTAMMACLDKSVTMREFNGFSWSCERWLAESYPSSFRVLDEFRGIPTHPGLPRSSAPRLMTEGF